MATELRQMDAIDRRLLEELQADARLSLAELGRRVGLSSPGGGRAAAAPGGRRA